MDKLLQLEKEIDGNETKNATNATSFKPCPEITSGCGECLANPECGFCRSTKKCMYGNPEGPSGQDNETCPGQPLGTLQSARRQPALALQTAVLV